MCVCIRACVFKCVECIAAFGRVVSWVGKDVLSVDIKCINVCIFYVCTHTPGHTLKSRL